MNNISHDTLESTYIETVEDVFNKYYYRLYKYILYRVGCHSVAEDLVSEVFEKVVAKYATFDPQKGKISTWLYTIANNTIINHYKKVSHLELLPNNLESGQKLDELVIEKETKEQLLGALLHLDERSRNIIALKFGAKLTNREIARLLNIGESNVGTILYRSLKQLKKLLSEES